MAEEFRMEKRALEVYRAGQPAIDAWYKRQKEEQKYVRLSDGEADDHKRGAVSPIGGAGWWIDPRIKTY